MPTSIAVFARVSRRLFLLAFTACLGLALPSGAALAEDEPIDLYTRVVRNLATFTVNADGSYVEEREWEVKVLKERAVEGMKRASINYSTSIQSAKILKAYTLKADGRRIDVPESNYQVNASGGKDNNGKPAYSDNTSMSVIFPEIAVGDSVVFAYALTAKEPMFPKHFSVVEGVGRNTAYDAWKMKIDVPASLWTQAQSNGLTETAPVEKDGRRIYEWSFTNPKPMKSKRVNYSVYDYEKEPGVFFSTFKAYAEISDIYGLRARPKAAVTPRVQKLADEIAGDKKEPRQVARALYEWVAMNIEYAGNCIGLGAVVPRDLDFILDNKMGDCKDHATLLQALLDAKGIKNTQALVNSGSSYRLPKVPVVSMVNHVITYFPDFDLYADSTSDDTPFGMLPFGDADKPVLLVDGYKDGSRTPAAVPGTNEQVMKSHFKVLPDGGVKAEIDISLRGFFAVSARSRFRDLDPETERDFIKNTFRAGGHIASGKLRRDDAKALIDTYSYGATFEAGTMFQLPGAGAFYINPMFHNIAPIYSMLGNINAEVDKEFESTCSNGRSVEEYVYEFPKTMKIISVPPNAKVSNDFLSYTATYTLKGNVLTIKRVLDDRTKGNVCGPAINAAAQEFGKKVAANLKAQVVYK